MIPRKLRRAAARERIACTALAEMYLGGGVDPAAFVNAVATRTRRLNVVAAMLGSGVRGEAHFDRMTEAARNEATKATHGVLDLVEPLANVADFDKNPVMAASVGEAVKEAALRTFENCKEHRNRSKRNVR